MRRSASLKDGTKVQLKIISLKDLKSLMKFFKSLPYVDRKYLRFDVTDKKKVEQRIMSFKSLNIFGIVAMIKDEIVAYGILEPGTFDWTRSQAEIRVIVSRKYQQRGLGMITIRELYDFATNHDVEIINAKMMRPQIGARKIFRKLGFREELLIPDYVKDQENHIQDLIVMTCDIKSFWAELELIYKDSDWGRCR